VELTGVEPVSKLGINTSLVHRFSFSDPRSGNPSLSRWRDLWLSLNQAPTRKTGLKHPLIIPVTVNGVKSAGARKSKRELGFLTKQPQGQLCGQKVRCCLHLFVLNLDLREWIPSRPVSQCSVRQPVETVTAPSGCSRGYGLTNWSTVSYYSG
jgi:hypothetical protein